MVHRGCCWRRLFQDLRNKGSVKRYVYVSSPVAARSGVGGGSQVCFYFQKNRQRRVRSGTRSTADAPVQSFFLFVRVGFDGCGFFLFALRVPRRVVRTSSAYWTKADHVPSPEPTPLVS